MAENGGNNVLDWYKSFPVVTRTYATLAVIVTIAVSLDFVSPLHVYLNWDLVWQGQVWRILTNFVFFGHFDIDFFFHMFFLVRYCSALEEVSYRNRPADFFWMLFIGAVEMLIASMWIQMFFLSHSMAFMVVYIWGRRNQYVHMSLLGIFEFTAPYFSWVLLGLATLLGGSPTIDLLGIVCGHIYYYLEDVYPQMSGRHLLKTPRAVKWLFEVGRTPHAVHQEFDPAQHDQPPMPAHEGAAQPPNTDAADRPDHSDHSPAAPLRSDSAGRSEPSESRGSSDIELAEGLRLRRGRAGGESGEDTHNEEDSGERSHAE